VGAILRREYEGVEKLLDKRITSKTINQSIYCILDITQLNLQVVSRWPFVEFSDFIIHDLCVHYCERRGLFFSEMLWHALHVHSVPGEKIEQVTKSKYLLFLRSQRCVTLS
jgi:hypothetical protein